MSAARVGLSPPTRGIPAHIIRRRINAGSIPAYAGDPLAPAAVAGQAAVYPRLRGGSRVAPTRLVCARGLSPPTRGIRLAQRRDHAKRRSIPAYAGDPGCEQDVRRAARVYPRLRGGSVALAAALLPDGGLSPPTRGIPPRGRPISCRQRSIPAYAGDPAEGRRQAQRRRVYPRLRGGSEADEAVLNRLQGLSPPTRGIRAADAGFSTNERSIPAYAGDPDVYAVGLGAGEVYPRLRGGSYWVDGGRALHRGLSPPTRGIPRESGCPV